MVALFCIATAIGLGSACSDESDAGTGATTGSTTLFGGSGGTGAGGCDSADSCAGDAVCDPATHTCVPNLPCTTHAECGGGAYCNDDGICAHNTSGGPCDDSTNCINGETCDNHTCGCGGELWDATNVPPNVLIVLDRSSSMNTDIGGGTKWQIAQQAIADMLTSYGSNVRFGLMLFPGTDLAGQQGGQCSPGAVFVDPGPDTAATINQDLGQAGTTSFSTPIAGALTSLVGYAGLADTTRGNYVLLITDGQDNCADDPVADPVAAVTALRGETPEVKTFVVGFGGEVDPVALDAMATAGGTAQAQEPLYYQCDNAASLAAAFASIAGSVLSCSYTLEHVPPDPDLLYVYADGVLIPRDPTHTNGWDYDPNTNQLTFYGTVCDDLTAGVVTKLIISYGCPVANPR
jgi:hypothetical protein